MTEPRQSDSNIPQPERPDAEDSDAAYAAAEAAKFLEGSVWDGLSAPDFIEALRKRGIYPGATFGRYLLEQEVGIGGSSIVYRATRTAPTRRTVAIKILVGGLPLHQGASRLEREREILAEMDHPGLAKILDYGTSDTGVPYLVMPFVHGEPIDRYCERKQLSFPDIAMLLERVCRSIEHAHQRHIVHRDLTPANILVQPDGSPVVTDFGIARWRERSAPHTATGFVHGTPGYLAPELGLGTASTPDAVLIDVFGIGATLYRLLTGRPPYRSGELMETVRAIHAEEVVAPTKLAPQVPEDLAQICMKCLSKYPRDRYSSVGSLGDDLQRFHRCLTVLARPIPWWKRAARWSNENRMAAGLSASLLATVLLALVAVTALWLSATAGYQAADDNLDLARVVVRQMTVGMARELYRNEGRLADQRRLLVKGLEFYDELRARRQSDMKLKSEYGSMWFQLGRVDDLLGDNHSATHDFRRSLEIFQSLLEASPDNVEWQFDLFHCYYSLYFQLDQINEFDESKECLVRATETLEQVVRLAPDNTDYLDALATVLQERAAAAGVQDNWVEAETLVDRAWEVAEQLAEHVQTKPRLLRPQGTAAIRRAEILDHDGRHEEALQWADLAMETANRLIELLPTEPGYHGDLANAYSTKARLLANQSNRKAAFATIDEGVRALRATMETYPDWTLFKIHMAELEAMHHEFGSAAADE